MQYPYAEIKKNWDVSTAIEEGRRPALQPTWDALVCELIAQCWHPEAEQRPTAAHAAQVLSTIIQRTEAGSSKATA